MIKYKKVYLVAPANMATGGPETIHQICSIINKNYPETAYMVYLKLDNCAVIVDTNACTNYEKYHTKHTTIIEDNEENLLIVPEVYTNFLKQFKKIKCMVSWLSYAYYSPFYVNYPDTYYLEPIKKLLIPLKKARFYLRNYPLLLFRDRMSFGMMRKKKVLSTYNSLHEKKLLKKHRIVTNNFLCGPLSDEYFEASSEKFKKEKIISFNPKKGYEFTKTIIQAFKNKYGDEFTFIAINNMTNREVINTLGISSLYIDFGFFPGPERIPRQAALMKANIVTSNLGAAGQYDVMIPKQYKFKPIKRNINRIIDTMYELAINYNNHVNEFDDYRELIKWQKDVFDKEVIAICNQEYYDFEDEWNKKR